MRQGLVMSFLCLAFLNGVTLAAEPAKEPTIALKVEAMATLKTPAFDKEIPILVTVKNNLKGDVYFRTFDVKPNSWNGETIHISLVDVYRDGEKRNLFQQRPKVDVPKKVSGMRSIRLEPGQSTLVRSDIRKWTIDGGWVKGKYSVTARVDALTTDSERCSVAVTSEPFEFEIK